MPVSDSTLAQKLGAEAVGTAFLLAAVVGSGIMAESLADGNVAIALLGNTIPTGAMLVVIILMFGRISGAHFNPAVTFAFAIRREIQPQVAVLYLVVQILGAIAGVWTAHAMFDLEVLQTSVNARTGSGQWFAESVATFGLVLTILGTLNWGTKVVAASVGLYITSAYWFTASTSFANPAVTIGRTLTNSFSGILPSDAPAFISAQFAGALLAVMMAAWVFGRTGARES